MTEKHMFADVSLPFHVWVREGHRWVLRDAAPRLEGAPSAPAQPSTALPRRKDRPPRHR
jgi:hypothetical protein